MPRPSDLSPAWLADRLARWEQEKETFRRRLGPPDGLREMWLAGVWLREQLARLGLAEEPADQIEFAYSQIAAHREDPWAAAAHVLSDTRAGRPPEPGPKLAVQLLQEADLWNSLSALFAHWRRRSVSPAALELLVDPFREHPRRPPPPPNDGPGAAFSAALHAHRFSDVAVDALLARYREFWESRHDEPAA